MFRQNFWLRDFTLRSLPYTEAFGSGFFRVSVSSTFWQSSIGGEADVGRSGPLTRKEESAFECPSSVPSRFSSGIFSFCEWSHMVENLGVVRINSRSWEGVFGLVNRCCMHTLGHFWRVSWKYPLVAAHCRSTASHYEVSDNTSHTLHYLIVCFLVLLNVSASKLICYSKNITNTT